MRKTSITLLPLLAATLVSLTGCNPNAEISADPTQFPSGAVISEATETPTVLPAIRELSTEGPWVTFGCEDTGISIADVSGNETALPFTPEPLQPGWIWSLIPSPATPYVIGYAHPDWDTISDLSGEGIENLQLTLFRLPEMSIEWTVPVIAPEAVDELRTTIAGAGPEMEDSPVRVNATNVYFFASPNFSPDGQFVSFSAVTNGSDFDLFVYDIRDKTVKVLADSAENESGTFWAPDSRTLVYRIPYPEGMVPRGDFWSVSVDGQNRQSLLENAGIDMLEWVSNTLVLVQNSAADFSPSNLRLLDTSSGEIVQLYPGVFAGAAYDPAMQTTFLNLSRDKFWQPDVPEGIYRLTPSHPEPELVSAGIFTRLEWQPEWGRFMARRVDEQVQTVGMEFFSPEGEALTVPNSDWYLSSDPLASPDGKYALVKSDGLWLLYQSSGEFVREIGPGRVIWLPDSSGFLHLEMIDETSHTGIIYSHALSNNWNPRVIISNAHLCTEEFSILKLGY